MKLNKTIYTNSLVFFKRRFIELFGLLLITIFILPPSIKILKSRLINRDQQDKEIAVERMKKDLQKKKDQLSKMR